MSIADDYIDRVRELLEQVRQSQSQALEQAAELIARSLAAGGVLHLFGTGHSHMIAEEVFYRAGGIIPVDAMLDLHHPIKQAASDWAFGRESPEQVTLSLIVLHRGNIIHERYAAGVDMHTRTRTWSTAKSIAVTLIGELVEHEIVARGDLCARVVDGAFH